MSRLTNKHFSVNPPRSIKKCRQDFYIAVEDKLRRLEDIEDELGIDLITFVKLTKAKEVYDIEEDSATTFTYIDFENHLIVCIDDFDEMSGRNFEWSYRFKDYGKTWALTKEELEKGEQNEQHN